MAYLHWDEQTLTDFSPENITAMYGRGYVFTRKGKGVMQQTRSCRINLAKFELSSENRRILKKTDGIELVGYELPYSGYDFTIGKMAKYFYDAKFGRGTMSANKMKEMMTDPAKSSFNCLFTYRNKASGATLGYAVCYTNEEMHHYSYPFYDLAAAPKDMGMGMMVRAVEFSKKLGHEHIYLGSLQRPTDTYKLQFSGLEWFDGESKAWRTDADELKKMLCITSPKDISGE